MNETQQTDTNYQIKLISFLLNDSTSFSRCRNIINPEYFSGSIAPSVRFILEYADEYNSLPTTEQISAKTGIEITPSSVDDVWLLNEVEQFCRYRAIENVILNGPDLLAKGSHAEIEQQIKDAMTISLITDLGDDYFKSTKERMDRLKNRENIVSTGWRAVDHKLYGGFTRGSLNVFAGQSGSGKSLFLQNLALNWANMGMNVIYITLELSQDLVGNRLDSIVTGMSTKAIFRDSDQVCYKIEKHRLDKKPGAFWLKKMPEGGTTCNDIRAYLKEFQIKTGVRPQAVLIDYLDLVYPNNAKVDTNNLFGKDKAVSEEMRAIGGDWDIPIVSASQLNRSSHEAQEFDHSHIAGGISKINTSDCVFAIRTSLSMRESGRYGLEFLKTRSANAVGTKIDLAYDIESMRISDMEDYQEKSDEEEKRVITQDQATGRHATAAATINPILSPMRSEVNDLLARLKK